MGNPGKYELSEKPILRFTMLLLPVFLGQGLLLLHICFIESSDLRRKPRLLISVTLEMLAPILRNATQSFGKMASGGMTILTATICLII